jgi:hypothetical protein
MAMGKPEISRPSTMAILIRVDSCRWVEHAKPLISIAISDVVKGFSCRGRRDDFEAVLSLRGGMVAQLRMLSLPYSRTSIDGIVER